MAIPGAIPMPAVDAGRSRGIVRVVSPEELIRSDQARLAEMQAANTQPDPQLSELARHVRQAWTDMRNPRNSANSGPKESLNERLLSASRQFNGQYEAQHLAEIRKFGGSEVYAKIVAAKCRGATALLREIYLGPE